MKQIVLQDGSVAEAMNQIDILDGLNVAQKGCLRLLTEEMFSTVKDLFKVSKLDFEIDCEGQKYTLIVSTRTQINEEARAELLSMSTDGRNALHKGIKGVMRAMMELMISPDGSSGTPGVWQYDVGMMGASNHPMWTLSEVLTRQPQEKLQWDGMEKSIIANFADDVSVGISGEKLQMTVTKTIV